MIKIKRRKNYHHHLFQLPPRTLLSLAPKLDGLGPEVEKAQTYNQVMLLHIFLVVLARTVSSMKLMDDLCYLPSDDDSLLTELDCMALILLSLIG